MPIVTATPRGQANGQVLTEFVDSVGTTSVIYTYPKTQESITVYNKGLKDVTITVAGYTQTIQPGTNWCKDAYFSSFSIRAVSGTQQFEALSDEVGLIGDTIVTERQSDQIANLSSSIAKGQSIIGSLLELGDSSVLQVIGDSTGNDSNEWVHLLAQKVASVYTNVNVKYALYNNGTGLYGAWENISNVGEDRHLYAGSTGKLHFLSDTEITKTSPDLDVAVHCALDDWQVNGGYLLTKMNGAGHYCFGVYLTSNRIFLYWSADGTNLLTFNTGIDTTAFIDGTDKWIRITLDVDNGAAGYTATGYTSTDGVTWTQSGTSTVAGATSIFTDSTVTYKVGGRDTGASPAPGKYYEIILRDGIAGANIMPQPIEVFQADATATGYFAGTPTLYIFNGSVAGSGVDNWNDSTYIKKAVPKTYGALLIYSLGHNDGTQRDSAYTSKLDNLWSLIRAKTVAATEVLITQNPILSPAANLTDRRIRRKVLMGYARRNSMHIIDTYAAFLKDSRGLAALINADGLHPNTTDGEPLWADTVWRELGF